MQQKADLFLHHLSIHTSITPSCPGANDKELFFDSQVETAIASPSLNPINSKIQIRELSAGLSNLNSKAIGQTKYTIKC